MNIEFDCDGLMLTLEMVNDARSYILPEELSEHRKKCEQWLRLVSFADHSHYVLFKEALEVGFILATMTNIATSFSEDTLA